MPPPKLEPGVTILHGDDQFAIEETLAAWYQGLGDSSMADLNTTRLDWRTCSENDLRTATDAMPFLAEQRLVILRSLMSPRMQSETNRKRFLDQIEHIAPSTSLVLVIEDHPGRKDEPWEVLKAGHWLRRWAETHKETARIVPVRLPGPGEMRKWILERARLMKGQFTPQAAEQLAMHLGNDTSVAVQEIRKLLDYVDYRRPVEPDDVIHLVAQAGEVNVFDLIDALGNRRASDAQRLVQKMLEKEEPLMLLGLVARHFRLLLVVREVIDEGGWVKHVLTELRQEPFRIQSAYYAEKLCNQARAFTLARLKDIYRRLLAMDEALKSSQDGTTVFAVFIAELTT